MRVRALVMAAVAGVVALGASGDNVLGRPQKLTPKAGADPRHLIGQSVRLMPKVK